MSTLRGRRVQFLHDHEALGGAGVAASRLANGLSQVGCEVIRSSNLSARIPLGEPQSWASQYIGPPRALEVLLNGLRRIWARPARALAHWDSQARLHRAVSLLRPDLIHVHGIHAGRWNHRTLESLASSFPLVWTFHDCWPFAPEAMRYVDAGGAPIRVRPDGDPRAARRTRERFFARARHARWVSSSRWVAEQAASELGLTVQVIPNGLDLEVFSPRDPAAIRDAFGIERSDFVLGFAADNRLDPLKGFEVLHRALHLVSDIPGHLVMIGDGPVTRSQIGRWSLRGVGRVVQPELLSLVYAAADTWVMPSLGESMGQVAMEAIACGTPVIGSAVGGLKEVVLPGRSGWTFPPGDHEALALAIRSAYEQPRERLALAQSSRTLAQREWSIRQCVESHIELYRSLFRQ